VCAFIAYLINLQLNDFILFHPPVYLIEFPKHNCTTLLLLIFIYNLTINAAFNCSNSTNAKVKMQLLFSDAFDTNFILITSLPRNLVSKSYIIMITK
jgi:hypothetical protein